MMEQSRSGQTVHFMFENSPIGMCSVSIDGTVIRRNAACDDFLAPDSSSIFAAVPGERRGELLEAMRAVVAGSARAFKCGFDWGSDRAVEISGLPMLGGSGELMLHLVDVSDRRRRERELRDARDAAEHDALTGLQNVRKFHRVLDERLKSRAFGTLLMIDLDGFKAVNDTCGHRAGDTILVGVASVLRESIVLLRVEGSLAFDTAAQIIARIERGASAAVPGARVSASIGLVSVLAGTAANVLLEAADRAMYAAKRSGRGRTVSADHDLQTTRVSYVAEERTPWMMSTASAGRLPD
jgi:diguanylate cyclase (GGDEF)-like protein